MKWSFSLQNCWILKFGILRRGTDFAQKTDLSQFWSLQLQRPFPRDVPDVDIEKSFFDDNNHTHGEFDGRTQTLQTRKSMNEKLWVYNEFFFSCQYYYLKTLFAIKKLIYL